VEPAIRRFDRSFAPIPRLHDRSARQNRYRPPPAFPLASPYPGIVHHLSGRTLHALPRTRRVPPTPYGFVAIAFATPPGLQSLRLACKVHSLVRVSRRAADNRKTLNAQKRLHWHLDCNTGRIQPNFQGPVLPILSEACRSQAQH